MANVLRFPALMPEPADYPVCNELMTRIRELAPYDSNVHAAIHRLADGTYHTIIAVQAFCGRFQAEAKTLSLVSSVKQAHKSMLAVLVEWKKGRFKSDT